MNVTERINRILSILSTVSQKQGISVEELAAKVSMRPRQLIKELEFITLIGKPPFKPDDYIDIYVEEGCVFIEFDQELNRPLRFTRPEAVALLMSLEMLDPELDPPGVRSLKEKIENLISQSVDSTTVLEDRIVLERPGRLLSDHFRMIRQAIEENRRLRIDYYSLTRNQTGLRTIRPYLLLKYLGSWYLTGHCESRKAIRTFKFERILSVSPSSSTFPAPDDFDVDKYRSEFLQSMGRMQVQIRFDAEVAPWIREQWSKSVTEAEGGSVVLTLFCDTLEFPSRLVLGSAPYARPLSPQEFIEKVRLDALEIYDLYQTRAVV